MLIHLQSFIRTCVGTHLHISLYTAKRKKSRHTLLSLGFLFLLFFLPFFFLFPLTSCFDLARSFAWQNIHIFMCHSQTCLHTVFASILFRRTFSWVVCVHIWYARDDSFKAYIDSCLFIYNIKELCGWPFMKDVFH